MSIAQNLDAVRQRMAEAARRSGRRLEEVSLMAVSKTFSANVIREAYSAGQRLFGENRVQEFAEKYAALADLDGAEFHLIGHLQSNKAVRAADLFTAVDSLDSLALARKLNGAAAKLNRRLPVLLEINLGGEAAKSGVAPDSPELETLLTAAPELEQLELRGLMAIPPLSAEAEGTRSYFRTLHQLRDRIAACKLPAVRMDVLSMGMSQDFEVAIEEGSTCVRLGTAIFGERKKNSKQE